MTQSTIDLTGPWRFIPDPMREGESLGYHDPGHDTRVWREVELPATFDECLPALVSYEGPAWFRRSFEWDGKGVPTLRFEGVNYDADVWINGRHAGSHEGGFLRFKIPIGHLVANGRNTLVVRADNTRREGCVPGKQRGWRPFGGVLREVFLDTAPTVHLSKPVVTASHDGSFVTRVTIVNTDDHPANAHLAFRVVDALGKVVAHPHAADVPIAARGSTPVKFTGHAAGVAPWSPDSPTLYSAEFVLTASTSSRHNIEDHARLTIGFRTIETRGTQILLNGKAVRLAGFNRHEDTAARGPLPDVARVRADLLHMKSLGANFVRLCHYPHHPTTLDLCDELGLLAMGEIPVYWWSGDPSTLPERKLAAAKRQLGEMIERDVNHASLVFWSVSNETNEPHANVHKGNAELVALAKSLDPTRLAVHVSHTWHWSEPHFENDDVVCVNGYPTYTPRGSGDPAFPTAAGGTWWSDALDKLHAAYPEKPILVAEFGYTALPGVFEGGVGEEAQAEAIRIEAAGFDKPFVAGCTVWCYADHPWPEEAFLNYVTTSPYGVVTRDRRAKRGAAACRDVFARFNPRPALKPAPAVKPERIDLVGVHMIRPHLRDIPQVPFPQGYGIRGMTLDDASLWEDIWRDAEPFSKIGTGLFRGSFGDDPQAIPHRCYLITAPDGTAAGTLSAWYESHRQGLDWGRIHWVAVRKAHQGKGLSRSGMTHAMNFLATRHERAWLVTHPARLGAIKIYLDFGFVPDYSEPHAHEAWAWVKERLKHPGLG